MSDTETLIAHMTERVQQLPLSDGERTEFLSCYRRYLCPSADQEVDWARIAAPPASLMVPYADLAEAGWTPELLRQVCVLKLNGGLGTSMGCTGPKALLPVRGTRTFLDLTLEQIDALAATGVQVPLVLMNSYNTDADTKAALAASASPAAKQAVCFEQSRFPRIDELTKHTLEEECPALGPEDDASYAPPGHGNLLMALVTTGTAQKLIGQGIKYAFVSNCDNLGATLDAKILNHVVANKMQFLSEYTPKTLADVKGGTLITYKRADGSECLRLLERAQVPKGHEDEFCDISKFTVFNTNSLYIDLEALVALTDKGARAPELDLIINHKKVVGRDVVQLETAVGCAISLFERAGAVVVSRDRFLPVKTTSDLFIVRSDLFDEHDGHLTRTTTGDLPRVQLAAAYTLMDDYSRLVHAVPSLKNVETLRIDSAVNIEGNEAWCGNVILV